jgi:hypothetical protein
MLDKTAGGNSLLNRSAEYTRKLPKYRKYDAVKNPSDLAVCTTGKISGDSINFGLLFGSDYKLGLEGHQFVILG